MAKEKANNLLMQATRAAGIIHRDNKPENVMIREESGSACCNKRIKL